ncbi:MAG: quinolinate synthase NadA [Burkholderiales bacterium]|nr:quinolinate synthase NadA [Burkholderiales bacterium]
MTQVTAAAFDQYTELEDADCGALISVARQKPSDRAIGRGHHYQRTGVYKHTHLKGDSLKLCKPLSQANARFIVFCGVHFMAEVADILSQEEQLAFLPDMAAGCSMADMANLAKDRRAWTELFEVLRPQGKIVQFMSPLVCMCSTINRIDPQPLAWCPEKFVDGTAVNQIPVIDCDKKLARLVLQRVLNVA